MNTFDPLLHNKAFLEGKLFAIFCKKYREMPSAFESWQRERKWDEYIRSLGARFVSANIPYSTRKYFIYDPDNCFIFDPSTLGRDPDQIGFIAMDMETAIRIIVLGELP